MNTYNKMLAKLGGGPPPKELVFGDGKFFLRMDRLRAVTLHVANRSGAFVCPILKATDNGGVYLDPITRECTPDVLEVINSVLSDNLQLTLDVCHERFLMADGRAAWQVFSPCQHYKERLC